jgi:hypothetical protein
LAAAGIAALVLLCARYSFVAPPDGLSWTSAITTIRRPHSIVQALWADTYLDFIPSMEATAGRGPLFQLGLDPWFALEPVPAFPARLSHFFSIGIAVAIASRSWQCGSLAAIVVFWLSGLAHAPYSYFQGAPVRIFFPSIFLLLFSLYTKSPRLVSAISGFMIPFAIYWNPETGLVCLGAAVCFLIFDIAVRDGSPGARRHRYFSCALLRRAVPGGRLLARFDRMVPLADSSCVLFSKFGYFNLPDAASDVWCPHLAFCLLPFFPARFRRQSQLRATAFAPELFWIFCAMLSRTVSFYQGRLSGNWSDLPFPSSVVDFHGFGSIQGPIPRGKLPDFHHRPVLPLICIGPRRQPHVQVCPVIEPAGQ